MPNVNEPWQEIPHTKRMPRSSPTEPTVQTRRRRRNKKAPSTPPSTEPTKQSKRGQRRGKKEQRQVQDTVKDTVKDSEIAVPERNLHCEWRNHGPKPKRVSRPRQGSSGEQKSSKPSTPRGKKISKPFTRNSREVIATRNRSRTVAPPTSRMAKGPEGQGWNFKRTATTDTDTVLGPGWAFNRVPLPTAIESALPPTPCPSPVQTPKQVAPTPIVIEAPVPPTPLLATTRSPKRAAPNPVVVEEAVPPTPFPSPTRKRVTPTLITPTKVTCEPIKTFDSEAGTQSSHSLSQRTKPVRPSQLCVEVVVAFLSLFLLALAIMLPVKQGAQLFHMTLAAVTSLIWVACAVSYCSKQPNWDDRGGSGELRLQDSSDSLPSLESLLMPALTTMVSS